MQSQQKKVKWSRGETADALEERTDTGITQVSVSKMENIISDIYGNISRRPAFKVVSSFIQQSNTPALINDTGPLPTDWTLRQQPYTFVFTKDTSEYFIFVVGSQSIRAFHIKDQKFVGISQVIDVATGLPPTVTKPFGDYAHASFAQSNNWGVLSNVLNDTIVLRLDTSTNTFLYEKFDFSAPWYAPNGTQTLQISSTEIPGLSFNSASIGQYTYTEANGETTVYSWISTGLSSQGIKATWVSPNQTFYVNGIDITGTGVTRATEISTTPGNLVLGQFTMTNNSVYTSGQSVGTYTEYWAGIGTVTWDVIINLREKSGYFVLVNILSQETLDISNNITIQLPSITALIPEGSIVQFPNNGAYMRVEGYDSDGTYLRMYGSFLTPVADKNATDTVVKVETGYVSLQDYQPLSFAFSNQRLYASNFYNLNATQKLIPGYAVGSQIGRYTDFKNDYNLQSEAVIIDINTAYQEKINYIVDYNGLKIFTTDAEYTYTEQYGAKKQSTNGSFDQTKPTIFGSALLYIDKTGKQLRALQYELQTDVLQSNILNQMCQEDLVFNPISISTCYDKEHYTGSFIYLVQAPVSQNSDNSLYQAKAPLAVCNFVPGNQAQIWARWTAPTMPFDNYMAFSHIDEPVIVNSITVNNKVWFIVAGNIYERGNQNTIYNGYSLAELDYSSVLDFEINAKSTDTKYTITRNLNDLDKSLDGWYISALLTVYTEHGQNVVVGSPVYNRWGQQINTVSAINTSVTPNTITVDGNTYRRNTQEDIIINDLTFPNATVSVFDGNEYKWDDILDSNGNYTKSLASLTNPRVGFMINATLESHPIDIQGKTYTEKKRIGKCVAVIRDTEPGTFTVCDKSGYTSPDKKTVNFYGCTGMKDLVRYTIKNIQGAKFTIESLTMIIEHGTLDS